MLHFLNSSITEYSCYERLFPYFLNGIVSNLVSPFQLQGLSTAADTVMGSSELDSVNKMVDVIKAEVCSNFVIQELSYF